jgi:probable rRNA maturation factor
MADDTLLIRYTTKGRLPSLPFALMKQAVLGKSYELSVAVVGATRMRAANRQYRGKDSVTDILSFPFDKTSGEILLNIPKANQKARLVPTNGRTYLGYLFIHGLLHLKGHDHGSIMNREEKKLCRRFGISMPL